MYIILVNSIVVYTCITGGYDTLRQPKAASKGIDYICFTDNTQIKSGVWKLKPIPDELKHLSNVKKQRVIKICPHRYLKEYSISIWVDGNLDIQRDLTDFVKQYDLEKCPLYVRVHPCRKCIYEEAKACIRLHKDTKESINRQIEAYRKDGYPKNIGMVESCVLLRKHNDIKCQLLSNLWASELLKYSHRDQLSFNYACWKLHFVPGALTKEFKVSNSFFRISKHAK